MSNPRGTGKICFICVMSASDFLAMCALGNLQRALRARARVVPDFFRSQIDPPMTDPELDAAVAEIQVTGCDSKLYNGFFFGRGYRPILANGAQKETQSKNPYVVSSPL